MMSKQKQKDFGTIIIQVPKDLKLAFSNVCKEQDITISRGIRQLIQSVVDGQLVFEEKIKVIEL